MSITLEGRLQTQTLPVDDLVAMVQAGEIRIPSFQRGLRWQRPDVLKLFDSIVRGYPIGNLLLWRRRADAVENLKIGALQIKAPALEQALFVVDGQQRLTSLSNALSEEGQKDPRFALAYDVAKEQFVPTGGKSVYEIPLPVIFDLTRLLQWYGEHGELTADPALMNRANRVAKAIREFKVPVYIVDQSDPDVLRDIFDRMNNYGKQLTRAEVFSALHESGDGERTSEGGIGDLSVISADVHAATGFGIIDDDTIFLAMLARRGADTSRDIRREFLQADSSASSVVAPQEFPGETPSEARQKATEALDAAIRFLQTDAHAPHFAFLPYRYLLVVLTRFFAHFPEPQLATRRNLRRWFWRAANLGPEMTKGNITYATRSLCMRIIPGKEEESIAGLLSVVGGAPAGVPDVKQFKTNYAATRLMVAAMWDLQPRRLSISGAGEFFTLEQLLDSLGEANTAVGIALQIFPSRSVSSIERALAANRVLIPEAPGDVPESVLDVLRELATRAALGDLAASEVLASHAVSSEASTCLTLGDNSGFVRTRQELLTLVLEEFLARQTEWNFEDTPSLRSMDLDEEDAEERDDALNRTPDGE